jgi:hypothetical protein
MTPDNNHTPAQLAEQAGNMEMHRALEAMRQATTQGERVGILYEQLAAMVRDGNPHAAAGASVALIAFLDRGMMGVTP